MLPYRSVKSVALALSLALGVVFGPGGAAMAQGQLPDHVVSQFGAPPSVPTGDLPPDLAQAVQVAFVDSITQSGWGPDQTIALETIKASGDPRLAWIISDLLRFVTNRDLSLTRADTGAALLQIDAPRSNLWGAITDPLIAWDIPAPPDYLAIK